MTERRIDSYGKSLLASGILPEGIGRYQALRYLDRMPTIDESEFVPEVPDLRYMTQEEALATSRYFRRSAMLIEATLGNKDTETV